MQYNEGTVSTTAGSATITGASTAWLANVKSGDEIQIGDDQAWYTVAIVLSDTSLTINVPYPSTLAGQDYVINSDFTTNLSLPKQAPGDLNTNETFTRAMEILDAAYGPSVAWVAPIIAVQNTPPGSPASGDRYIVSSSPTGAWVGHEQQIAQWDGAAWQFTAPTANSFAFVTTSNTVQVYNGSLWTVWTVTLKYVGNGGGSFTADAIVTAGIKLTGGTPGTGKVMVSDADGDCSWVDPSLIHDNTIRKTLVKTGLAATLTDIFKITTPAEKGGYSVKMHWMYQRRNAGDSAIFRRQANFAVVSNGTGNVVHGFGNPTYADEFTATTNIAALRVSNTSSTLTDVSATEFKFSATPTFAGGTDTTTTCDWIGEIELIWYGYSTPPVITLL